MVTLGATALLAFDPATGGMELRLSPEELLAQASQGLAGIQTRLQALPLRSGASLTFTTLAAVRGAVLAQLPDPAVAGCVLLAGTDTLDEAAFVLHLMLAKALARHGGKPLVLTGSMRPADALGSDNARNLRDALVVSERGWLCVLRAASCADVRTPSSCRRLCACAAGFIMRALPP